ncbi:MAG TPA: response regulator [Gallionellaceae bacterium]|nr:response regulator [Gallionellaceae bacterium]
MNLDPRTVVILTVLSTLLMSISLFAVARGYLAEMRGITRWAFGTLLQSVGWILLALIDVVPSFISELGSPLIMLAMALYFHALTEFKELPRRNSWIYIVVGVNLLAIYFFLLIIPDMAARIVVASATAALLMFASAKLLLTGRLNTLPVSHSMTGVLFAVCSAVLVVRAVYYLVWHTAPDQSAFEQNIVQDIAFLTFFVAAVLSPFSFILMCNDRYNAKALTRTQELANKNIELEEASRAKGQFLATMSHELRTPLNGVIGFLNQLGKTRLDERQKDYLHTVDLSARMLLGVINDILDFSKIEAGKLSIESVDIYLRDFLDETISMFAVSAEEKGLDLVCVIDKEVPTLLMGDPLRLTQVLSNLLSNAIKFTEQGEVLLEVRLLEETDTSVMLDICVSDTGIGISQQSLDRLFQPFVQADASTTRKHGGTGLGLIIARRLVDMMGGSIEVESKVWHGTRFTIHLGFPKQEYAIEGLPLAEALSQRKILTVTPNPNVALSIAESVAILGMTTQTIDGGLAALALMQDASREKNAFDAVIFDYALKDMLPREFAELMKADVGLSDVKMLLLANISFCHQTTRVKNKGFSCCISKPVKSAELYHELAKLFVCGLDGNSQEDNMSLSSRLVGAAEDRGLTPLRGKRVLVVDDNNINRKLMQLLVAELGGEFDLAENGVQAVDACSRREYDVILMDVNMPVMDGLEATSRIRTLESSSRKTPIIALTANALPGDKEKFIAHGMDDYLSKPINEKALHNMLNKLLGQEVPAQLNNAAAVKSGQRKPPAGHPTELAIPVLDPKQGIELSFGDQETWHIVLAMLLDDLGEYAHKLSQVSTDIEQLSRISHKLVGSSCYCGTPALHQAARQVEMHSKQGKMHLVEESLPLLLQQIERLLKLDTGGKLRGSDAVIY